MKLSLSAAEGVTIVTCAGEVSLHELEVLRAGLSKSLKSGKNKIILEIMDAEKIHQDIIREISKFDILARELSGGIILAGSDPLKTRVEQFAKPPVITCFSSREAALQYFRPKPVEKTPAPTAPAPSATPASASPATDPNQQFKKDIRQKELTEATDLRKRISHLERENGLLKEQMSAIFLERREPTTDASRQAQLQTLNERLEELLNQAKATQA